jgi:putative glycosyltransferase (TIGR04372 family)
VNLKSKLPTRFQKYASFGIIPKLLLLPFAAVTLLGMRSLRPFVLIRVHKVHDWRIGHFATNTELTRLSDIVQNENTRRKCVTIYYFGSKVSSNPFLTEFWQRELPSVAGHWGWLLDHFSSRIAGMNTTSLSSPVDKSGLLKHDSIPNFFTRSEINLGNKFLENCQTNSKYICLNVRDSEYLTRSRGRVMSHHDYRDSDIKTYVAAAEMLAEMGYTVFRMGAIVKEPLDSNHPRVIDYATNGMRTEFLDVFLGAHCTLTISVGSGWDSVPTIFRRPIMFVNQLPVFAPSALTLPLVTYPKILLDGQTGDTLNLENLIDREIAHRTNSQAYKDAGVEIRDLSSEELVEAVTEMAQRVEGTFVETPEQKEMQAKLKHILSTHPKLQPSPNYYPIRAQFASCFLSRFPNFLHGLS